MRHRSGSYRRAARRPGPQRVDALEHERRGRERLVADLDRALERRERRVDGGVVVGVQLEERLALGDGVAGLREADDAGGRAHRVLLARAPRAEAPRRDADAHRVEALEHAVALGCGPARTIAAVASAASGSPPWAAIIAR